MDLARLLCILADALSMICVFRRSKEVVREVVHRNCTGMMTLLVIISSGSFFNHFHESTRSKSFESLER